MCPPLSYVNDAILEHGRLPKGRVREQDGLGGAMAYSCNNLPYLWFVYLSHAPAMAFSIYDLFVLTTQCGDSLC